jgi:hypothetical protein
LPPYKNGIITGLTSFAFGFTVTIKADVSGCDSLASMKIDQQAWMLIHIQEPGKEDKWSLMDKDHDKAWISGDDAKPEREFWNTHVWDDFKTREDLGPGGTTVYKSIFERKDPNTKINEKSVQYYDAPPWLGGEGQANAPSADKKEGTTVAFRYFIKVTATGTDGKSVSAMIWRYQCATSDGKTWKIDTDPDNLKPSTRSRVGVA